MPFWGSLGSRMPRTPICTFEKCVEAFRRINFRRPSEAAEPRGPAAFRDSITSRPSVSLLVRATRNPARACIAADRPLVSSPPFEGSPICAVTMLSA